MFSLIASRCDVCGSPAVYAGRCVKHMNKQQSREFARACGMSKHERLRARGDIREEGSQIPFLYDEEKKTPAGEAGAENDH